MEKQKRQQRISLGRVKMSEFFAEILFKASRGEK